MCPSSLGTAIKLIIRWIGEAQIAEMWLRQTGKRGSLLREEGFKTNLCQHKILSTRWGILRIWNIFLGVSRVFSDSWYYMKNVVYGVEDQLFRRMT
jgi:hypothetical protein